jgi:tripartite-type tricarboxylate transporter receptor subunit TctC
MNFKYIGLALGACAAVIAGSAATQAQDYPKQTIRIICPFTPGGGSDLTARFVADGLSRAWGQSVVVENRPGAASQIGIDYVAKAKPDGYTLLWTSADGISVLPAVKAKMPYKIPESFEFVSTLAGFPLILGVTSQLPITNMQEFIAYAKAHPGELKYSSSGAGGGGHLEPAYMGRSLGFDIKHVPYESAAPATVAVAGGHAHFVMVAPSTVAPYVKDGTIRALATTGAKRTRLFPDVATVSELGYPNLTEDFYYGMYAPAGTPPQIVKKLRDGVQDILKSEGMADRLLALGLEPMGLTGDEFKSFVVKDLNRWTGIAKDINFQLQ